MKNPTIETSLFFGLEPNVIIAICAVLVSIFALFVSINQAFLSRKHNRLSVEPHLSDWLDVDECFHFMEFTISNKGLGTALICKYEFLFNNKVVSRDEAVQIIENAAEHDVNIKTSILSPDSSLAKDETISVLKIQFLEDSETPIQLRASIIAKLDELVTENFKLRIEYKSIYGVKKSYTAKPIPD